MDSSAASAYWLDALAQGSRFMDAVAAHPIEECGEPLVSIPAAAAAAGVAIDCPATLHPAGRARDHRIRRGNVGPLLEVARELAAQGLTLVVEDALRSLEAQRALSASRPVVAELARRLAALDPAATSGQIVERLAAVCAATPKTAGHMAGAAIDVSIRRADGAELDRGAPYLDFSERMPMDSPFVTDAQAQARRLVTAAMARHGFAAYPFEFWHYSRGDGFARVASDAPEPAVYGPVDAGAEGAVTSVRDPHVALNDPQALAAAVRRAMDEIDLEESEHRHAGSRSDRSGQLGR